MRIVPSFFRARVKRYADRQMVHMKPERTDGKAARRGGGFPFGRITANGGEARGSAHGGYGEA